MKQHLFFILFSTILFSPLYSNGQNKVATGFYFLAETEAAGQLVKDKDDETMYAVEREAIITTSDFAKAKMSKRDFKPTPQKVIEIKLTKAGRKKWGAAKQRALRTGEAIMFVFNDRVYIEKRYMGRLDGNSTIDLFLTKPKELEAMYDEIASKIVAVQQ